MDSFDTTHKRKMISWPVLALMDFVTVIGFDDIIYNFKNQGLATISEWIIMLALYVVPYEMVVGQLGSTFSDVRKYWLNISTLFYLNTFSYLIFVY